MKLDDRDIICQQDYAPLSNAELLTQIEENLEWLRGAALFDTERVMGPVRALLARAEAAEALAAERLEDALFAEQRATDAELERDDAILAASDAERHAENAMHGLAHFRARVAELESQLAAQGWRPVTEDWPPYGVKHLGRAMLNSPTLLVTRTTDDSDEVWQDNDGMLFYGGEIRYCAAIPPLSAPQEPTP